MDDAEDRFARALGDALRGFLEKERIKVTEAAQRMEMPKQTLSAYWSDSRGDGKRNKARAMVLYMACAKLGFEFEYNGYKIGAVTLSNAGSAPPKPTEQLPLPFDRQFSLIDGEGLVSISVRRQPPGKVEVSFVLKATS